MSLPKDYQAPKSESKYLNKFEDGTTRIRVLSDFIIGWSYWVPNPDKPGSNKPVRVKEELMEVPAQALPDKYGHYVRHFWCGVIWNYKESKIQIMEITQKSIQDPIYNYEMDEDWGDVKSYDLKITRTKENDKVKYEVTPAPKTELSMDIANAFAEKNINLNALYDGKDPFGEN